MGEETTILGGIHISPNAVATIAYHATLAILWRGGACTEKPGRWDRIHHHARAFARHICSIQGR